MKRQLNEIKRPTPRNHSNGSVESWNGIERKSRHIHGNEKWNNLPLSLSLSHEWNETNFKRNLKQKHHHTSQFSKWKNSRTSTKKESARRNENSGEIYMVARLGLEKIINVRNRIVARANHREPHSVFYLQFFTSQQLPPRVNLFTHNPNSAKV